MAATQHAVRATAPVLLAAAATAGGLVAANRMRVKAAEQAHPPVGRFAPIWGADIHFVEAGQGRPILLVHGNGVMLEDWLISGLFDELATTNRVIALDRPGFGHSSRPRGTRWTPEVQADLLAGLLDRVGAEKPIVVGHSFGALVAAALAVRHPGRLGGLVLLGGVFYPQPRADVMLVAGSAVPVWGDLINWTMMPLLAEAMQKRVNHRIFGPAPVPEVWRRDFSWAMALRPTRMRAGAADAVNMNPAAARLAPLYPTIDTPVTIISGRGDRIVDPAIQSERLHQDLPTSRLTLVEGAGHMVHHTAMREVAAAIRSV